MAKKKTTRKKTRKKAAQPEAPKAPDALLAPAPCRLSEIVGHARPLSVLAGAIASDRVHHAWIFHGPRGVGKRTAAVALAAALLDPTTTPGDSGLPTPDPESHVARLLASGAHPDFHMITKELARYDDDASVRAKKLTTIPKAVIEEHLIRRAGLAPQVREGLDAHARKVFVIDEAERLDRSTTNAPVQNAILKTLEEPPEGTVIILVTESEDRLLPTIRSRCQRVAFMRLSDAEMASWVDRAGSAMPDRWSGLAPDRQRWLVRFASGSPGALVEAVEAELDEWHAALREPLAKAESGRLPVTLGKMMGELVDARAAAVADADKNASKSAANIDAANLMFRLIAGDASAALAAAGGDHARLRAAARNIDAIETARRRLASNVSVGLVFEGLAADLATPPVSHAG